MNNGRFLALLLVAGAAACSKTAADRSQTPRGDDADEQAATERQGSQAAEEQRPGAEASPASAQEGPAIITITGVFLEPTIASTCGIPLSPKAFFEFDATRLDTSDKLTLQDVATCLTTGPLAGRKIEVIGHTDPRGPDEYNRQLGRSRAQSVQEFLEKQGVPSANLVVRSMGEQRAEESEPIGWSHDRRVDLRLLPPDGGQAPGAAGAGNDKR